MSTDSSTLRRGIEVLMALQQGTIEGGWGNNKIAEFLGADKSQISRTLKVLVQTGLVERDARTRVYRLGSGAYSIGMRAADQHLMRIGAPIVRQVVRVTEMRSFLVVREGSEVLTIWSDQPANSRPIINSIGMTYSIAQTETGRALLYAHERQDILEVIRHARGASTDQAWQEEFLRRVANDRRNGFSFGEVTDGSARIVAVPIWDTGRKVVAAIAVSSPDLEDRSAVTQVARVLLRASADLTARLTAEYRSGASITVVPYRGWPRKPLPSSPR